MCALVTGVQPCALPICFGGLFALYALYTRPQAFHSIVAASPSLELDGGVLRDERDFVARLESGKVGKTSRLMIVVGGRDIDDDPEPARALADRFDRLSGRGLRVRFKRYEEEGHMARSEEHTSELQSL